jgi:hypothetical protein
MAKDELVTQCSVEEMPYPIDWTPSLLNSATLSSVAITHIPPSGTAATITSTIVDNVSYIEVPAGLIAGTHYVICVATTSNSKLSPVVRLTIQVNY